MAQSQINNFQHYYTTYKHTPDTNSLNILLSLITLYAYTRPYLTPL